MNIDMSRWRFRAYECKDGHRNSFFACQALTWHRTPCPRRAFFGIILDGTQYVLCGQHHDSAQHIVRCRPGFTENMVIEWIEKTDAAYRRHSVLEPWLQRPRRPLKDE